MLVRAREGRLATVGDFLIMIITSKKLQKYGAGDHREAARMALARLSIGEEYFWEECKSANLATQADKMVWRWRLRMRFAHVRHGEGFLIKRIS